MRGITADSVHLWVMAIDPGICLLCLFIVFDGINRIFSLSLGVYVVINGDSVHVKLPFGGLGQ